MVPDQSLRTQINHTTIDTNGAGDSNKCETIKLPTTELINMFGRLWTKIELEIVYSA